MSNELKKFKVSVEIPCDCQELTEAPNLTCELCKGEGFIVIKMPLLHLKNLLEGGSL